MFCSVGVPGELHGPVRLHQHEGTTRGENSPTYLHPGDNYHGARLAIWVDK